jgi:hypothetical protein
METYASNAARQPLIQAQQPNRYPCLQFLIGANMVIAVIVGAIGVIIAFVEMARGYFAAILFIPLAVLAAVIIQASGEMVQIFIQIERNTRKEYSLSVLP